MGAKWDRAKSKAEPSVQPVYTYALVLISLMAPLGIQSFRYIRVWTPLERHYLPAYVGSQMAGVVRDNGSYTLLQVVTRKGSRLAVDSDVLPTVSDSGENTFALTEEAVKHGALGLELRRAHYDNAEMHAYLGKLIYQNQSLMELVRPASWGGLVIFFAGILPATYLDRKRLSALRHDARPRRPELATGAQLSLRQSSCGMGFISKLHTMLGRVLRLNKKMHVPMNKENPSVSVTADPLLQKPIRMPAAVGADNPPGSSSTRREPTPQEQTPIQEQEFKPTVKPTPRRFFE